MTEEDGRIRRAARNASITAVWGAFRDGTIAARLGAHLAYLATRVRNSFLFRWLTREPDPDVVVIDLSETRTVGPFLRAIDWGVRRAEPHWRSSRIKRELDQAASLGARLGEPRPVRQLSRLLAPPTATNSDEDAE